MTKKKPRNAGFFNATAAEFQSVATIRPRIFFIA